MIRMRSVRFFLCTLEPRWSMDRDMVLAKNRVATRIRTICAQKAARARHARGRWSNASLLALVLTTPLAADAQLRMTSWRSDTGQVYQVLQHRAGDDLGVGIDEVRITSVAANSTAANTCRSPPMTPNPGTMFEALAYGPLSGGRPLDLAFKSRLIADASDPCFSSSAEDGTGRVCIGPSCASDCSCADGASCTVFTLSDGIPFATATPETPAAHLVTPLTLSQTHCSVASETTFGFGTSSFLTTRAELCSPAPSDGVRLAGSPSAYTGGTAGTSVVFVYDAMPDELIAVAAAGFGIDTDGRNPFDCDAPGRVVAALTATDEDGPSTPPPGPPVDLDEAERACQKAIARAGRRFVARALRAMHHCRDRILEGTWRIEAARCGDQPAVRRSLDSAGRMARSAVLARCEQVDLSRLLTCGDRVDDLVGPDGRVGCLVDSHRNLADLLALVEYGF